MIISPRVYVISSNWINIVIYATPLHILIRIFPNQINYVKSIQTAESRSS